MDSLRAFAPTDIPSHSSVKRTELVHLEFSDLVFDLVISPISNDEGGLIGHIYEWRDMTEQTRKARDEAKQAAANARVNMSLLPH